MDYDVICNELRINMLEMVRNGKSAHLGGSFSCIDFLYVLYKNEILHNGAKLVYSKGHAEVALYSLLEKFQQTKPIEDSLKQLGSIFQGHPSKRWIENLSYSSGSLGQGLSFGLGLSLSQEKNVFVILGDGELQEGQIWEAVISAVNLSTKRLIVFVDCNGYQLEGKTVGKTDPDSLATVWSSLGWKTKVIDGHNFTEIIESIDWAKQNVVYKPTVVFAKTTKGKGVSFMENNVLFHGVSLLEETIQEAQDELRKSSGGS